MITIVSLFTEREYCLEKWFEGLENLDYDKKQLKLVWVNNGQTPSFRKKLEEYLEKNGGKYHSYMLLNNNEYMRFENEKLDAIKVHEHIGKNYNECRQYLEGEYFLSYEDDIVPPADGLKRLIKIFEDDKDVYLATGKCVYRPSVKYFPGHVIAWDFNVSEWLPRCKFPEMTVGVRNCDKTQGEGIEIMGGTHFGFTLLKTEFVKNYEFKVQIGSLRNGFDLIVGYEISKMGKKCVWDWDLKLKHYDIDGKPY